MRIGLVMNTRKPELQQILLRLFEIARQQGCLLLARECEAGAIPADLPLTVFSDAKLTEQADLLLAIGGDGTILEAARLAQKKHLPVAGLNLGRVGFLSTFPKDALDRFGDICRGNYRVEKRQTVSVFCNGEKVATAVNEIAFLRDTLSKTPEFLLAADGASLGDFRTDGLLFATATGSTAYTQAVGGPILPPETGGILMTPVCPIGDKRQSILFSEYTTITLACRIRAGSGVHLTADGQSILCLAEDQIFTVTKGEDPFYLVQMPESRFFETLTKKIWKE